MEILKFLDKTWQEIPDQDNPAMQYWHLKNWYRRHEECIMIFKGRYKGVANGGFVVAKVPLEGDITLMGIFWLPEAANLFAVALVT